MSHPNHLQEVSLTNNLATPITVTGPAHIGTLVLSTRGSAFTANVSFDGVAQDVRVIGGAQGYNIKFEPMLNVVNSLVISGTSAGGALVTFVRE